MLGDARKIEIILLPSKWQMFFKSDGKFDFREIFPQILRQAEILGRLFVFFEIRYALNYHSVKWLTTSANVSQKEKSQHKKIDCPYPGDPIVNFHLILLFFTIP